MEFQIIPKQECIPPFDTRAIKIQRMEYFDWPCKQYNREEITDRIIAKVLKEIPDRRALSWNRLAALATPTLKEK